MGLNFVVLKRINTYALIIALAYTSFFTIDFFNSRPNKYETDYYAFVVLMITFLVFTSLSKAAFVVRPRFEPVLHFISVLLAGILMTYSAFLSAIIGHTNVEPAMGITDWLLVLALVLPFVFLILVDIADLCLLYWAKILKDQQIDVVRKIFNSSQSYRSLNWRLDAFCDSNGLCCRYNHRHTNKLPPRLLDCRKLKLDFFPVGNKNIRQSLVFSRTAD